MYLTAETREPALQEDFRRRALGSGSAVFLAALVVLILPSLLLLLRIFQRATPRES
ncbi:hypothetical protein [Melittangium boletus]|uniref:Cytochrome bd ubiquinol oxidase subunit II n=1 Tax=Melittangium boletus DSM 14713 TaxID=1294270 RepID=A0A250IBD1_9BACT|nr:hypothetical protein [Melittangium boletus]ATB29174.1 cytochrome bd ubiquinol oxidase subunit II [Melittangium boletus DSM 14713]